MQLNTNIDIELDQTDKKIINALQKKCSPKQCGIGRTDQPVAFRLP